MLAHAFTPGGAVQNVAVQNIAEATRASTRLAPTNPATTKIFNRQQLTGKFTARNLSNFQFLTELKYLQIIMFSRNLISSRLAAVFCLLTFAFYLPKARANDSAFSGSGGTPKLMRGEHRQIAMQSEKIVITADDQFYDTVVDFVFRNDGGAANVQMGFPESSYGDVEAGTKSTFLRFETSVDGRRVPAKRIVVSGQNLEQGVEAFWLKTVRFAPRQTRRVRVSYRSAMGGTTSWGTRNALAYYFSGENWKGLVERSDLEIRVKQPGLWIGLPMWKNGQIAMNLESKPDVAIFRKTWRNWQAQGGFLFGLTRAVPFWMLDRDTLDNVSVSPAVLANAKTFRVGPVPQELPQNAENPPAFVRGGVTYVSLSHLTRRLDDFASDLEKYRKQRPVVHLKWDAKTGSHLQAGNQVLSFKKGENGAISLGDSGYPTLYVPLAPVADKLGLSYQIDPKARLFRIKRGAWTGK